MGEVRWQEFLSCYSERFEVVRASTPALLDQAYRLRYQVYCIENAYEDPVHQMDGRETDRYDDRSVHALLFHKATGVLAGTVRVILPGADTQRLPLPIYEASDLSQRELLRRLPHSQTAELSRFAVSKEFRCRCTEPDDRRLLRYITIGLLQGALGICRENEIHYVCALMERALIRLLSGLGLNFEHVGDVIEYRGFRQPCIARVSHLVEHSTAGSLWRFATHVTEPSFEERAA